MSEPVDSPGERVPAAETPDVRTEEQELAAGRTAATPVAMLGSVAFLVACGVAVVLGPVVLAYFLA